MLLGFYVPQKLTSLRTAGRIEANVAYRLHL